jgi:transcriptional regulator GlxA family with amidase domain
MLRAEFPNVQIASELFVVDRDRMTCTGGTTPLDMMLNLLSKHLGQQLVTRVSQHLILARLRRGTEDQPMPVGARVGFLRTELVEAVKLMEANIEDPLSFAELARLIEMSERQMQRIFKRDLNMSPRQYYRTVRLKYAGGLLRTSNESIEHVSSRCGFNSLCRFSKAYRREFGHAPIIERRIQK